VAVIAKTSIKGTRATLIDLLRRWTFSLLLFEMISLLTSRSSRATTAIKPNEPAAARVVTVVVVTVVITVLFPFFKVLVLADYCANFNIDRITLYYAIDYMTKVPLSGTNVPTTFVLILCFHLLMLN